jgi:hypothetical protein
LSSPISPPGFTRGRTRQSHFRIGHRIDDALGDDDVEGGGRNSNRSASITARPSTLRKRLSATRWRAFRSICSEIDADYDALVRIVSIKRGQRARLRAFSTTPVFNRLFV